MIADWKQHLSLVGTRMSKNMEYSQIAVGSEDLRGNMLLLPNSLHVINHCFSMS